MAVPKKRTSSSKTKSRHATWVNKAAVQRERAISLAKSVLNDDSGSFIYSNNKNSDLDTEETNQGKQAGRINTVRDKPEVKKIKSQFQEILMLQTNKQRKKVITNVTIFTTQTHGKQDYYINLRMGVNCPPTLKIN